MARRANKDKTARGARPIKTERDYLGAASVAKKILRQGNREADAERRLQALIEEMEKFDQVDDDPGADAAADDVYSGPRRRWSDDSTDPE